MTRKGLLVVLLILFIVADLGVGKAMISSFSGENQSDIQKENGAVEESDIVTEGYEQVSDGGVDIEDYSEDYDGEEEEEKTLYKSGDVIDLIDDGIVPCIYGKSDDIYERSSLDEYEEEEISDDDYEISNYGNKFVHLMTCMEEDICSDVGFSLGKKYSKLSFTIGLWEKSNKDTSEVVIYKGVKGNKKKILKAKRKPGQKEKKYTVNVSDCDTITIRLVTPDFFSSYLVTDGFKLTVK